MLLKARRRCRTAATPQSLFRLSAFRRHQFDFRQQLGHRVDRPVHAGKIAARRRV